MSRVGGPRYQGSEAAKPLEECTTRENGNPEKLPRLGRPSLDPSKCPRPGDCPSSRETAPIRTEEQTVKVQLAADLSRAERQNEEQLQEIEYQIQQCDAQLSGLEHTLTIKAPFSGHLVYRNPSPSTALTDNPLLVLAPAKGLRLRIRLASLEANALEKAGPVILEMVWQDVQRRFLGYLIGRCELNHDPGFVMGELACNPPAEAVRDLGSNKTVKAQLLWSPAPLQSSPLQSGGCPLRHRFRGLAGGSSPVPARKTPAGDSRAARARKREWQG